MYFDLQVTSGLQYNSYCTVSAFDSMASCAAIWGNRPELNTGFCRLVEGVPTNSAAVANHSCMHYSIMASAGFIQ